MMPLIWVFVFVLSMAFLLKASDWFTASAEIIGFSLGMSPFVIGVLIVGVGTSLPELVSSIFSVINGASEIVIGNVLGSNVTNIFLVLGLAGVVGKNFRVGYNLSSVDLPLLAGSSLFLGATLFDRTFSFPETILCLAFLSIYLWYSVRGSSEGGVKESKKDTPSLITPFLKLLGSGVLVFVGAKYTVDSVIALSNIFNIGKEVIAQSAVAIGTSLPEVSVSVTAARKGKGEMAVGNILGSNIFNSLAVTGFASLFGNLVLPESILYWSLPMSFVATFLFIVIIQDKRVSHWEGGMLLLFYVLFLGKIFGKI